MFTEIVHVVHVMLAGVWLGGVVFTAAVVSPALKSMKWSEAERVGVRSAIGRQYARVGSANLALLLLFAVLDGALKGFGATFYAEYLLLLVLSGLVAAHGAYFGRRLARLAEAEKETRSSTVFLRATPFAPEALCSSLSAELNGERGRHGPRCHRVGVMVGRWRRNMPTARGLRPEKSV